MNIKQMLDERTSIEQKIFDYFDFQIEWHYFPLEDSTQYFWSVSGGDVYFSDSIEGFQDGMKYYSSGIAKVYEKPDYTLITNYTGCDGNSFASIFDNSKRIEPVDSVFE